MNWYIGQPIVAIKNHSRKHYVKGKEEKITGLAEGCEHYPILLGIGRNDTTYCEHCGKRFNATAQYDARSFEPLDINISELTDILSQPVELVNN